MLTNNDKTCKKNLNIENIQYLDDWSKEINEKILKLEEISSTENITTFFSISTNTTIDTDILNPYITPMRRLENGVIFGVVVFSQSQAIIAANLVKDAVDNILVDSEKKIPMQVGGNNEVLDHFGINVEIKNNKSRSYIEFGNISSAVKSVIDKEKIIEYKPNDITVDAVWTFLSIKLNILSGKKISIIGCGNIGFKLALKLTESGANVILHRRDATKGMHMANAINMIKSKTTIAIASFSQSALQASSLCDVLVGTANSNAQVITWDMIQSMANNGFVVDVGKGNIEEEALKKSYDSEVDIFRGDVMASLYGFISHNQKMQETIKHKTGRLVVEPDIELISGGIFGKDGDIIVDNCFSPSLVYGVSDGCGHLKVKLNQKDRRRVMMLNDKINNNFLNFN
jgi:hypothetical protein